MARKRGLTKGYRWPTANELARLDASGWKLVPWVPKKGGK